MKNIRVWKVKFIGIMFIFCMNLYAGEYSHTYKFDTPLIKNIDNGKHIVQIDNTILYNRKIGEPILPMREAKILIPSTDEVVSIEVIASEPIFIDGTYTIMHSTTLYPYTYNGVKKIDNPASSVYGRNSFYPYTTYTKEGTQYLHGEKIIEINLFPVGYNPVQKKIKYYKQIQVIVKTKAQTYRKTVKGHFKRNLPSDKEQVLSIIDNKEDYIIPRNRSNAKISKPTRAYVIITSSAMKESFEVLAKHRRSNIGGNYTTYIEEVDNIMNKYSGIDRAEKIRNFIKDMYENYGTSYVLLGGDADGDMENHVVPMRSVLTSKTPTDLYYGCLDGTWNSDNDNIWGERTDGENGAEIDWLSEVYVGRIAADNAREASNQIYKIISYETQKHIDRTLLSAKGMGNYYPTWGGDDLDWVYDKKHPVPYDTLYGRDSRWGSKNMLEKINSNKYNWIIANEHGSTRSAIGLNGINDIKAMSNTKYFFLDTQGCYSGAIDNPKGFGDAIIEELTNATSHGAFAAIANSRNGYGSSHRLNSGSNIPQRRFTDAIFDGCTLGEANQRLKKFANADYLRGVAFGRNLFGCPATQLINKSEVEKSKIIYPEEGKIVQSDTLNIKWENNGSDKYQLKVHIQDSNNDWETIYDEYVYGNNETVSISEDFKRGYVELDSYKNGKYLGHNEVHIKAQGITSGSSSSIISSKFNESSFKTLTTKWNNNGADSYILSIYASKVFDSLYPWKKIYQGVVKDNSKTVTIPVDLSEISIRLISYQGNKLLGSDRETAYKGLHLTTFKLEKNTVTLLWKHNSKNNNTIGFNIYKGSTIVGTVNSRKRSYRLTGLKAGTIYTYSVKAYNDNGEFLTAIKTFETKKDTISVTKSIITSPKTGTKVVPGSTVTVTWENHGATRKMFQAGAEINGKSVGLKFYKNIQGTSTTFTIPPKFTEAYAYLGSFDKNGNSIGTSLIYIYPKIPSKPQAPSNLTATNIQTNKATITWQDNSSKETGFKVYRGSTLIATLPANVTSYTINNLIEDKSYTYTIQAFNSLGKSSPISITFKTNKNLAWIIPVIYYPMLLSN